MATSAQGTVITDQDLASLAVLVRAGLAIQPEVLDLSDCPVSDVGLAHVATIAGYHYLILSRTQVTDDGVAELNLHPTIRWIDLTDTRITDLSLIHLRSLPELSILYAERTALTRSAIEDFIKSRHSWQHVEVVANGYPSSDELCFDVMAESGLRRIDYGDLFHEQEEASNEDKEEAPDATQVQPARRRPPPAPGRPSRCNPADAGADSRARTLEPCSVG